MGHGSNPDSDAAMLGMAVGAAFATAAVFAACMAVVGLTLLQWNWEQLKQPDWQRGAPPASPTAVDGASSHEAASADVETSDVEGGVDGLPVRLPPPPCTAAQ